MKYQTAQEVVEQYQATHPGLSGDEVAELAEVGVTDAKVLWRQWEGPNCHLYLSARVNGTQKYGWWIDGDGAADIHWTNEKEEL